jgi:hypothetical protein
MASGMADSIVAASSRGNARACSCGWLAEVGAGLRWNTARIPQVNILGGIIRDGIIRR